MTEKTPLGLCLFAFTIFYGIGGVVVPCPSNPAPADLAGIINTALYILPVIYVSHKFVKENGCSLTPPEKLEYNLYRLVGERTKNQWLWPLNHVQGNKRTFLHHPSCYTVSQK